MHLPSTPTHRTTRPKGNGAHRPRILVVEDNDDFADEVRGDLETGGYDVDVTASVSEALERMRTDGAIDLVIGDLHIANDSGLQLLFADASQSAPPPVIMMSQGVSPPLRSLVEEKGASVIETPFSFGRLHASVIGALTRRRRAKESGVGEGR